MVAGSIMSIVDIRLQYITRERCLNENVLQGISLQRIGKAVKGVGQALSAPATPSPLARLKGTSRYDEKLRNQSYKKAMAYHVIVCENNTRHACTSIARYAFHPTHKYIQLKNYSQKQRHVVFLRPLSPSYTARVPFLLFFVR